MAVRKGSSIVLRSSLLIAVIKLKHLRGKGFIWVHSSSEEMQPPVTVGKTEQMGGDAVGAGGWLVTSHTHSENKENRKWGQAMKPHGLFLLTHFL